MGGNTSKIKGPPHAMIQRRGRDHAGASDGGNAVLINQPRLSAASPPHSMGEERETVEERFPVVLRVKASVAAPPDTGSPSLRTPAGGGVGRAPPPPHVEVRLEVDGFTKRVAMSHSGDDFFAFVQLPRGDQGYVVSVNGDDVVDTQRPTKPVVDLPRRVANVIKVNETLFTTPEERDMTRASTDGDWGRDDVVFSETRKLPPMLPPHLRYTPLNTPPTQYRCAADGNVAPVGQDLALDPVHLPLPLSVTLNHVYFQRREDHVVMGVTTRFRSKFTSVVYYKGTGTVQRVDDSKAVPVLK